jgi:hypothetical protein
MVMVTLMMNEQPFFKIIRVPFKMKRSETINLIETHFIDPGIILNLLAKKQRGHHPDITLSQRISSALSLEIILGNYICCLYQYL